MQPILISFSIMFIGMVAAVSLFSMAMRGRGEEETRPATKAPASTGHFFLDEVADPLARLSLRADPLRLRLEEHVRLEQEAAKSFLRAPSAELLQAPSASPMGN